MVPKVLKRTVFGNPILRKPARQLTKTEILSPEIQQLIADMKYTVDKKQYGVGLAAPQVGHDLAIARIAIKPTPTRPTRQLFDRVVINPKIIGTNGRKKRMWEGCISFGTGANTPYAQTMRWPRITAQYNNENGDIITEELSGLAAHVYQHEMDHLNGILFVDRVKDNSTFMVASEFRKRIVPTLPKD